MNFGVLREEGVGDRRVALTPPVVRRLVEQGNTVWVERGAGEGAMFGDDEYLRAGARIGYSAAEVVGRADLAMKISSPSLKRNTPLTSGFESGSRMVSVTYT